MTKLYRITVRQTELLEYTVEADSVCEAQQCIADGEAQMQDKFNEKWEIVKSEILLQLLSEE